MAVTFAAELQGEPELHVVGREFMVHAKITCTGTTTDNGDAIDASLFKLASLITVIPHGAAVDSESNPENAFVVGVVQPTTGTFKITFHSQAVAGATTPLAAITDGTSVSNYVFYVTAFGRA